MTDAEVQYEKSESGFKLRIEEQGEPVAQLAVGDYQMNVGGTYVRMGGIAEVVAHPGHRGKGYGASLLRRVVSQMRQDGYPISILFGIPDFYHRFGYVVVLPSYTVTVTTRNAERLGAGNADVRPATPEDAPALLQLYREANATRTGSLQRYAGHGCSGIRGTKGTMTSHRARGATIGGLIPSASSWRTRMESRRGTPSWPATHLSSASES
jgi:predicted acetyltransferase